MTIKIIQNNERIAEVQFYCDYCGKLIRSSIISKAEVEAQKNKKIKCWQCQDSKPDEK